ncbi:MAG: hypothetical protein R2883_08420 [Caldisericia bacterium]
MKNNRFFVYLLVLILLVIIVGLNVKSSRINIKPDEIIIPEDTTNHQIILDFSKKYYPEFEFIMRYSRRNYDFDDFIRLVQESFELAQDINTPVSEEMSENWQKTYGEKLSVFEMNMIACFWSIVASDFFRFDLPEETEWRGWQTEISTKDIAKNVLSIWVWDSFSGKTNGDKWYEIPHLKPAIFFGWSIQNNSCDVMRKNVNHLRTRFGLDFEMIKDVDFFQGISICTFWSNYLLIKFSSAFESFPMTIRELAASNWLYNASTRNGDVETGQYFRDILTLSYGEMDEIWYMYGLDEKAATIHEKRGIVDQGLFEKNQEDTIKEILKSLP